MYIGIIQSKTFGMICKILKFIQNKKYLSKYITTKVFEKLFNIFNTKYPVYRYNGHFILGRYMVNYLIVYN